jgi:hypothetical protein
MPDNVVTILGGARASTRRAKSNGGGPRNAEPGDHRTRHLDQGFAIPSGWTALAT